MSSFLTLFIMQQLTFLDLAKKILEEENKPLSPEEIWNLAISKGYDNYLGSKGKTPLATLGSKLYTGVKNISSPFISIGSSPKRFFLKSLYNKNSKQYDSQAERALVDKKIHPLYNEKNLHAYLAYYCFNFMQVYTKTIIHNKSNKAQHGEWAHPDMVGGYFPFGDWKSEVIKLSSTLGVNTTKFYSFELKKSLNFINLRESFFQTVSNSSWANESYLVAAEISQDIDFLNELERLSTSFSIGIIKLNITDPDSSEILFPARSKEFLDWDTINKLATLNTDFESFLQRIRKDIEVEEIRVENYDKILSKENLLKIIPANAK